MTKTKSYRVGRSGGSVGLDAAWDSPAWKKVPALKVASFRPESSEHRPKVQVKLQHDGAGICGAFKVEDQYVRCVASKFQDPVCLDSCVEFFVRPREDKGYINFEFSGDGTLLCKFIEDWTRVPGGFGKSVDLTPADGRQVSIWHSLPNIVEPEIAEPTTWYLSFRIPFALLEKYIGPLGPVSGQEWRANFFKCGDRTSHPHWASWSPVDALNFHLPHCFGRLVFE